MHSLANAIRRSESYAGKPPRNIIAPYQHRNSDHSATAQSGTKSLTSSAEFTDYKNFRFPELEDVSSIKFDKYCGPTPESNWVIPGVLLVGAYPASQDDAETYELITSILKNGVTKFVCLQQEYRDQGVTEEIWRSGHALRPYFRDVQMLVRNKAMFPDLREYDIVDEENLSFVHFPIRDCGVTDDGRVLELARSLVLAISHGEVIYLHCWGGHGRTGTLVCIMLHLMYGLDAVEAMSRCQLVHDLRKCPVAVGSPQTQTQRDQVTRIIHRLQTQTQFHRRTLSDLSTYTELIGGEQHSPRSTSHSTHAATVVNHTESFQHTQPLYALQSTTQNANLPVLQNIGDLQSQIDSFPGHPHVVAATLTEPAGSVVRAVDDLGLPMAVDGVDDSLSSATSLYSDGDVSKNGVAQAVSAIQGNANPELTANISPMTSLTPTSHPSQSSRPSSLGDLSSPTPSTQTHYSHTAGSNSPSVPHSIFNPLNLNSCHDAPLEQCTTSSSTVAVCPESTSTGDGGYFIGEEEVTQSLGDCPSPSSDEMDLGASSGSFHYSITARPPESVVPTSATAAAGSAGLRNFRMQWTTSNTNEKMSTHSMKTHIAPFSSPITAAKLNLSLSPGSQNEGLATDRKNMSSTAK